MRKYGLLREVRHRATALPSESGSTFDDTEKDESARRQALAAALAASHTVDEQRILAPPSKRGPSKRPRAEQNDFVT